MADDTTTPPAAAPAKPKADELPAGYVRARVLPLGDGLIHTGVVDVAEAKPLTYARGDIFAVPRSVAADLEARGFAEIQA